MKKFHYVYRISNIQDNMHYYGKRSSKLKPVDDLGKVYFSSSNKNFKTDQINNPQNYKYKVIKTFNTSDEALAFETKLQLKVNAAKNPKFYNKMIFNHDFNSENKVLVCDINGENITHISKDDELYLNGSLINYWHIYVSVIDSNGKTISIKKSDPRYNTTLFSRVKNTTLVKDQYGNNYRVEKDDPRILSGELVSHAKGMQTVYNEHGTLIRVSVNDENFINGKYISIFKNTAVYTMPNGTNKRLNKDDPIAKELKSPMIGSVTVIDKNGICMRVKCDDERIITGELTYCSKNMATVRDKNGNTFQVHKDDHRILSGEFISVRKNTIKILDMLTGEKYTTTIDNPLLKTLDILPTSKAYRCIGIDVEGNIFCTNIFDHRFSTGEIRKHKNEAEIRKILSMIKFSYKKK